MHPAVAVVIVQSEVGDDPVDPAQVDGWIAGRPDRVDEVEQLVFTWK